MIIRLSRACIVCLLIVLSTALAVRVFLITKAPFLYGQDAYNYLNEASNFAFKGTIQIKTGAPFVLFLGIFLKIFSPTFGVIFTSRLFMLIITMLLAMTTYFIGLKMNGRLFGLIASLIIIFEPYFLEYSIVPHNDIFAFTMGLLALYFIMSLNRFAQYLISPILFYIAVFTRPELYFTLIIPIFIAYLWIQIKIYREKYIHFRIAVPCIFVMMVYVIPSILFYYFAQPYGRLGLFERIFLFLRLDLFLITLNSSFQFCTNQVLNQFALLFILLSVAFILVNLFIEVDLKWFKAHNIWKIIHSKNLSYFKHTSHSIHSVMAFCIFLTFIIDIFTLTIWGFNYTWAFVVNDQSLSNLDILRQAIIITPQLHDRYLIFPMLLLGYPLAYSLTLILRKVYTKLCPH